MPGWKRWSVSLEARYGLHVLIHDLYGLPDVGSQYGQGAGLVVQVEWRGNRDMAEVLLKGIRMDCTSKKPVAQSGGIVVWDEGFKHPCKLMKSRSGGFKRWMVHLEIHGFSYRSSLSARILSKTQINVAEFLHGKGRTLRIPIQCNINGMLVPTVLTVTVELLEQEMKGSTVSPLIRTLSWSSRVQNSEKGGFERDDISYSTFSSNQATSSDLSTEDEPLPLENSNLAMFHHGHETKQTSIFKHISFKGLNLSFRAVYGSKGMPSHKIPSRAGIYHIDNNARIGQPQSKLNSFGVLLEQQKSLQSSVFEVGKWEIKSVKSRDGQMELITDVFFASIDQCSEKAAGGSACAVLVVVIANWLHKNRQALPIKSHFNDLIREGSSEWRKLCEDDNNKARFSNQHFDLETVLEAKIRPISVATDKSYVSFFSLDKMPEGLECLKETMPFDSIWENIISNDTSEEKIYITGWNDHFFILKIESEAIYLIDTLGGRLYEGCNQAYILKFSKQTVIQRLQKGEPIQQQQSDSDEENMPIRVVNNHVPRVLCRGIASCKEFIKGFLAAVPVRELQHDIDKGLIGEVPLHHCLQIDFHYTTPL